MQEKHPHGSRSASADGGHSARQRQAVEQLAQSQDAQKLAALLKQAGGVQQAAQAAAQGKPDALLAMVEQLAHTQEGAQLIERLRRQAEASGLS